MCDGELTEDEIIPLAGHIASCDNCRRMYNAFMGIGESLRQSVAEPPESLRRGVADGISITKIPAGTETAAPRNPAEMPAAEPVHSRRHPKWPAWCAAAACMVFVAYAAIQFGVKNGGNTFGVRKDLDGQVSLTASGEPSELPESIHGNEAQADHPPPAPPAAGAAADNGEKGGNTTVPETSVVGGAYGGFTESAKIALAGTGDLFAFTPEGVREPVLTDIDKETLDALFALLDLGETKDFTEYSAEPVYIMRLSYTDGGEFELKLWIRDGVVYTNSPGGVYYKSACDLSDFLLFLMAAEQ
jgi:hypothetical protein